MAVKIGSLIIKLAVEHGLLSEGLARSEQEVAKTTKAIQSRGREIAGFGRDMSLAVSLPLIALAKSSVAGFVEQNKAMADVTAALTSMGNASGKTADELSKTADQLEMRSLFDAEVILKQVTAQLLTFGNIAGREFDRAQQAAVDMATRLGTEPQSAAIMLGKALNDPIAGITALTRVGVQFTQAQRDQIKAMMDAGNIAGAQGVILKEVERQFAGAAQAAADTSPWRQAEVAIGQAMDVIGAAVLPTIGPIAEAIAGMASAFASLPVPVQQAVVVLGTVAAVVGPIAIGLGAIINAGAGFLALLGGFPAVISLVGAAMNTLLLSPLGLVVVAVGAVVAAWYYWDDIKAIVGRVGAAVSGWWSESVSPVLGSLGKLLGKAISWWWDLQVGTLKAIAGLVTGVKQWLQDRLGPIFDWVGKKVEAVTGFFRDMYIAVVGNSFVPDMVREIGGWMNKLDALMVDPARKAAKATEDTMRTLAERVRGILRELYPEIEAANAKAAKIGDLFLGEKKGLISADARRDAVRRAQGIDQGPLEEADKVRRYAEDVSQSLIRVGNTSEVQTVRIAKTWKDMVDDVLGAVRTLADGIRKGDFFSILDGVIGLFTQLGSAGVFGSKLQTRLNTPIPGRANGTAFHPGGLMMVGERGPEILQVPRGGRVVPNHELRAAGMQSIHIILEERTDLVEGRIDGRIAAASGGIARLGSDLAMDRIRRVRDRSLV